jgi:hypothetical protein
MPYPVDIGSKHLANDVNVFLIEYHVMEEDPYNASIYVLVGLLWPYFHMHIASVHLYRNVQSSGFWRMFLDNCLSCL